MRNFILVVGILLLNCYSFAQSFEIGVCAGETGYYGDLNEHELIPEGVHPAFQVFAQANITDRVSIQASYLQGNLSGTDANNYKPSLIARNLHFRTPIQEVALMGEFSVLRFSQDNLRFLTPFVTIGVAGFHFNPQAEYQGEWYDLQPLSTEGQGTSAFPDRQPYSLYQFAIPFGGGIKAHLSENWILTLDVVWRKTFTDYLDDVSATYGDPDVLRAERGELAAIMSNRSGSNVNVDSRRGTPYLKDMYQFLGVSISYRFSSSGKDRPSYLYCPLKF